MKQIFKFPLGVLDSQYLSLPVDAKIIKVGEQQGVLNLWAEFDPTNIVYEFRTIRIFPTGAPFQQHQWNAELVHLETIIQESGLVWHVYEEVLPK